MLGVPDEDHLAFVLQEGRVLFTHDSDYLILHAQGISHAGIVYASQGKHGVGSTIAALALIGEVLTPEEMTNHVEFI